jgi:pentatricopeptide repeat protein
LTAKSRTKFTHAVECLCGASIAFARGDYRESLRLATEAIRNRKHAAVTYNILGKALMKLNQYAAAVKCYERAQYLSPRNLERLCLMAEAYRKSGQEDKAEASLAAAQKVDASAKPVQEEIYAAAEASTEVGKIVAAAGQLQSVVKVVALTNNRAVALVKAGRVDEALQLYQSILKMVPSPDRVLLVPVNYNIGLACARSDELDAALPYLEEVIYRAVDNQKQIAVKAESLKQRIEQCIHTGRPLILRTDDVAQPHQGEGATITAPEVVWEAQSAVSILPGEIGCHLIFRAGDWPTDLKAKMDVMPHFAAREAVARDEAMGVERGLKN